MGNGEDLLASIQHMQQVAHALHSAIKVAGSIDPSAVSVHQWSTYAELVGSCQVLMLLVIDQTRDKLNEWLSGNPAVTLANEPAEEVSVTEVLEVVKSTINAMTVTPSLHLPIVHAALDSLREEPQVGQQATSGLRVAMHSVSADRACA